MCEICGKQEVVTKGKCAACYAKEWRQNNSESCAISNLKWRKNNPEKWKEIQRKSNKKWRETHPEKWREIRRNSNKKWRETHPEKWKEICKRRHDKYRETHPLTNEEKKELADKIHKSIVCNILKKHAEELKDDPDRLSTDFIKKMSNIKFRCSNTGESNLDV